MDSNSQTTSDQPKPLTNYQKIQQEIDTGNIKQEVWIEAYAKGMGNYNKAVSIYISLRADQMYKENTTFFRRTGDSVIQQIHPRNPRGKYILAFSGLSIAALLLFGAQPLLRASAATKYKSWCAEARGLGLPGKTTNFLIQHFGRPEKIITADSGVTYVYNPCSPFCFNKERFQFKVTINTQTATVSGWEWNAAFDAPESH